MFGVPYDAVEDACRQTIKFTWGTRCIPRWSNHLYVRETRVVIIRAKLSRAKINEALAIGIAEYELHRDEPQDGRTNPVDIALDRLLPPDDLAEVLDEYGYGITAVARFFNVTPRLVRDRIEALHQQRLDHATRLLHGMSIEGTVTAIRACHRSWRPIDTGEIRQAARR